MFEKQVYPIFCKKKHLINQSLNLRVTIDALSIVIIGSIVLPIIGFVINPSLELIAFSIACILINAIAFILIKKEKFSYGKLTVIAGSSGLLANLIASLPNESFYYIFILNVILAHLMFDYEQKKAKFTSLMVTIFAFLILSITLKNASTFSQIGFIAALLLSYVGLHFMSEKNLRYKNRLKFVLQEEQASIEALVETQKKMTAKELELHSYNEELNTLTEQLKGQNDSLSSLQDELKQKNQELFTKNNLLKKRSDLIELAKEDIEKKAQDLKQASSFKAEFFANMTHELRTPLNSVIILASILAENRNDTLTTKELEYANVIHKSGKDLLVLINDILDLSKVEAGKITVVPEDVKAKPVIDELFVLFEQSCKKKNISFINEYDSNIPELIHTDPLRWKQIIKNFLSNAVKFTPEDGEIQLKSSYTELKGKPAIRIDVKDSGIGIEKANLDKIFAAFQQADESITSNYGGTGLGLSISKNLTKLLEGELSVDSTPGEGSTFSVTIPTKEKKVNKKDFTTEVKEIEKKVIKTALVVEDNPTQNKVLSLFLTQENIQVSNALTGQVALDKIKEKEFDLILLDIGLPDMSGKDIAHHIHENRSTIKSNVVIFTAHDMNSEEINALELDEQMKVILKSTSNQELLDFVRNLNVNSEANKAEQKQSKEEQVELSNEQFKGQQFKIYTDDMRFGFSYRKHLLAHGAESVDIINEIAVNEEFDSKFKMIVDYNTNPNLSNWKGFENQTFIFALSEDHEKIDLEAAIIVDRSLELPGVLQRLIA